MSFNPYSAVLDMQREAWERSAELLDRTTTAPDAAETIQSVEVGQTPSEVVYSENKLDLLHYEPTTEEQHDVPILIVYALINRPYILDLQPDRSVVKTLLDNGFDVYLIDWGEPSNLDTSLTLDDYVNRYMDNCVDVVRERSGQDSINVLGYCMGGTMSAMYAALHPDKVRNLGLMAAGLCFEGDAGVLELWGQGDHFDPQDITNAFGNVPAEFLDMGFAMMDPIANNVTKYVRFYENMEDEDFVENFARMEEWLGDGIDVAGATFEEFIEGIYQENKLYRNELEVGGEHVDVDEIDMPVLQIVAEYDHLMPPEASKPFNDVVGSDDVTTMEFPTGHIGMSVSSKSHARLWPDVCEWFAERSVDEEEEEAVDIEVEGASTAEAEEVDEAVEAEEEQVDADEEDLEVEEDQVDARTEQEDVGAAEVDEEIDTAVGTEVQDEADIEAAEDEADQVDARTEQEDVGAAEADEEIDTAVGTEVQEDEEAEDEADQADAESAENDESEITDVEVSEVTDVDVDEVTDEDTEEETPELEAIDGIGVSYANRLRDIGIESVEDLAAANAEDVGAETDIPVGRIADWIDQANDLVEE